MLYEFTKKINLQIGECNQICRRSYILKDKESEVEIEVDNEYLMSPKDLKTIHFINIMLDAGVRVLKIEGRARGPEYVKTVVSCYKEAVDAYFDGTFDEEKIKDWDTRLARVFNRGFWDGYYLGQRLGEWSHVYGSAATHKKVYIGKVTNYFSKIGVTEILIEAHNLKVGDEILITGETTGAYEDIVEEIRENLEPVNEVKKGALISIKTKELIRRNDKVYKIVEVSKN